MCRQEHGHCLGWLRSAPTTASQPTCPNTPEMVPLESGGWEKQKRDLVVFAPSATYSNPTWVVLSVSTLKHDIFIDLGNKERRNSVWWMWQYFCCFGAMNPHWFKTELYFLHILLPYDPKYTSAAVVGSNIKISDWQLQHKGITYWCYPLWNVH